MSIDPAYKLGDLQDPEYGSGSSIFEYFKPRISVNNTDRDFWFDALERSGKVQQKSL